MWIAQKTRDNSFWISFFVQYWITFDTCTYKSLISHRCVYGPVAQWITRLTTDQKIPGSNPGRLGSFWTFFFNFHTDCAPDLVFLLAWWSLCGCIVHTEYEILLSTINALAKTYIISFITNKNLDASAVCQLKVPRQVGLCLSCKVLEDESHLLLRCKTNDILRIY